MATLFNPAILRGLFSFFLLIALSGAFSPRVLGSSNDNPEEIISAVLVHKKTGAKVPITEKIAQESDDYQLEFTINFPSIDSNASNSNIVVNYFARGWQTEDKDIVPDKLVSFDAQFTPDMQVVFSVDHPCSNNVFISATVFNNEKFPIYRIERTLSLLCYLN